MDLGGRARRRGRWRALVLVTSAVIAVGACGSSTPTPAPLATAQPKVATAQPQVASAAPTTAAGPSLSPAPSETMPAPSGSPPAPDAPSALPSVPGLSPEPSPGEPASSPGPTSSPAPPAAPDSASLIAAAEAAGTIDHDTALLYDLYAALDYASLPPAYQSTNPAAPEATTVLAELSARSSTLSPDLQAKVAPFFLRPDDPGSIWAKRATARRSPADSAVLAAYTAAIGYGYVDAASAPIRVWFPKPGGEALVQRAVDLATEIDASKMWSKEQAAMLGHTPCSDAKLTHDGGSGFLDVYLISTNDFSFDGRASSLKLSGSETAEGVTDPVILSGDALKNQAVDNCAGITFIVLDAGLPFDRLRVDMAHELFHAFSFSFQNSWAPDRQWWMEASATWAEDLVYPQDNTERARLYDTWAMVSGPEGPLDRYVYGGPPQYGAYLWPFYLRQKLGSTDGSIVGQLWQASQGDAPLQAMPKLDGWPDMWKEFALWNWNNDDPQLIKYRDGGEIPPQTLSQLTTCLTADECQTASDGSASSFIVNGTRPVPMHLAYASIEYLAARPDTTVGEITFDLSAIHGKPGLGLQAILWIGDPAKPDEIKVEDWSDRAKRQICLDVEDVRRIVLVESNSNVFGSGNFSGSISVEASVNGCVGWVGTITGQSTTGILEHNVEHNTSVTTVHFIPNPFFPTFSDVEFVSDTGTVAWTWEYTSASCHLSDAGSYELTPYDPNTARSDGTLDLLDPWPPDPNASPGPARFAGHAFQANGTHAGPSDLPTCPKSLSSSANGVITNWWRVNPEAKKTISASGKTITGGWTDITEGGNNEYSWSWTLRYVAPH